MRLTGKDHWRRGGPRSYPAQVIPNLLRCPSAGLSLLSEFQPDIVKLDMGLVRGIETDGPRQAIVRAIWQVCIDLGIDFLVEGIESLDEFSWFTDLGAYLYQGYLFAKPMFEAMPPVTIPTLKTRLLVPSRSTTVPLVARSS